MALELELVTKLKARLKELDMRAANDMAEGICVAKGHQAIEFEYGYSLGYRRGLSDCGVITDELQADLIKGEDK